MTVHFTVFAWSSFSFSARGSLICHLATEHGKILDVMRNDSAVDMKGVIELLQKNDSQIKEFYDKGTKSKHDGNFFTIQETYTWK